MSLFSANPKKLKGILYRVLGKKAKITDYLVMKINNQGEHDWTHIDLDDASKETHYKPKKIVKTLRWLKKHNVIQLHKKKMEVRFTPTFLKRLKPWTAKYLNQHKALKGQVQKEVHSDKKDKDSKKTLTDTIIE